MLIPSKTDSFSILRNYVFAVIRPSLFPDILFRLLFVCFVLFCAIATAHAIEPGQEIALPSFAELQAAGAVIGEIRVNVQDIFDLDDPKEHNFLFRLANTLHINTRPDVIRRTLLFKSGQPVSVRLIEETERLLHDNRYLAFACMAEKSKCAY